jgi:hypothetical protein
MAYTCHPSYTRGISRRMVVQADQKHENLPVN